MPTLVLAFCMHLKFTPQLIQNFVKTPHV